MMSQKQKEAQIHMKLLTTISDKMVETDKEYENFVSHMSVYVEPGLLAQHKTLLGKLRALETKNLLGPGNYGTLKDICSNSGNIYLIEVIESAEKEIMAVRNKYEQDTQPESKQSSVVETEDTDGIEKVSKNIREKDQPTQCNPGSKSKKRASDAIDQWPFGFKRPRVENLLQGIKKRDTSYSMLKKPHKVRWISSVIVLNYVLEVLKPFCNEIVNEQHRVILSSVRHKLSIDNIVCDQCVLKELKPHHAKGIGNCIFGQSKCNCQYPDKKACPNNVCGIIHDEIMKRHAFLRPASSWTNTNIKTWCTDPWSVAKCFISTSGYKSISIEQTDISGILQMILNDSEFHTHLTDLDRFSKVRRWRNELLHSPTMELDEMKFRKFCADITTLLEEPKLIARQETTNVMKILQSLKEEEGHFKISTSTEIGIVSECIREHKDGIKQLNDEIRRECQTNQTTTNENREMSEPSNESSRLDERVRQLERKLEELKQTTEKQLQIAESIMDEQLPVELKKDPFTRQVYSKALKNDNLAENSIQVMVIGCYNHGKTSLVRRLLGQELDGKESSNGIAVHRCIAMSNGVWKEVEEELEDKFVSQPSTYTVHKHDKEPSFPSPGTSCKMESENSFHEFKKKFQKPLDTPKDKHIDLSILDLSGQFTYYATHPILLSTRAVYILVINLADHLDKKLSYSYSPGETHSKSMREYISFWVNSIHTFVGSEDGNCPPIILVGTHKDEIDIDDSKVFREVRGLFNGFALNHLHMETFSVSNTKPELSKPGFRSLRSLIIKVGKQLLMNETPGKWRLFENELKMRRKHQKVINLSELDKIDNETDVHGSRDTDQLKLFLTFQHERGTLCYFNDAGITENVLIDPTFLIDAFKCLIKSKEELKARYQSNMMWKKLCDEAILQPKLLEEVWSGDFLKFRDILLEFLQRHHIISNVQKYFKQDVESAGYYLVPSFLKSSLNSDSIYAFLQGKITSNVSLRYENIPQNVLPILFNRILAALVGRWPISNTGKVRMIFDNFVACEPTRDHAVLLILEENGIELLTVSLLKKAVRSDICDEFRRFVEKVLQGEIYKLRSKNVQKNFLELSSMTVRCRESSHDCNGSACTCDFRDIKNDSEIPCPDKSSNHVIKYDYIKQWIPDRNSLLSKCSPTSNRRLTLKEYSKLAAKIGRNWQEFAKTLGFSEDTIDQIEFEADKLNVLEQSRVYQLFLKWDEREGENASTDKLVQAVIQTPGLLVDLDEIKNLVNEF